MGIKGLVPKTTRTANLVFLCFLSLQLSLLQQPVKFVAILVGWNH